MEITDKQERFCQEYLIDLNATQSAIRAGYSHSTAQQIGSENLTKLVIRERILELNKTRLEATGITQKRVLEEYAKAAFFDIRKIYGVDGALLPISQIGDAEAGALAGVKTNEIFVEGMVIGETKEVKVFDKLRALDALAKYLGLFEKDNEQSKVTINPITQITIVSSGIPLATSEKDVSDV
jgi:phage terminase small subunit